MTDLAEASDELFTHADLNDLWDGIMDDVTRLTQNLLGPKLKAAPKDKRGPIEKLWQELLDQLTAAGPARIDYRGFVAHDGPSPVKEEWDGFWEAVIEIGQELIDEPELLGEGKRVPTSDASHATEFQLIVWCDYRGTVGHFFVELRPNVGKGYQSPVSPELLMFGSGFFRPTNEAANT